MHPSILVAILFSKRKAKVEHQRPPAGEVAVRRPLVAGLLRVGPWQPLGPGPEWVGELWFSRAGCSHGHRGSCVLSGLRQWNYGGQQGLAGLCSNGIALSSTPVPLLAVQPKESLSRLFNRWTVIGHQISPLHLFCPFCWSLSFLPQDLGRCSPRGDSGNSASAALGTTIHSSFPIWLWLPTVMAPSRAVSCFFRWVPSTWALKSKWPMAGLSFAGSTLAIFPKSSQLFWRRPDRLQELGTP